MSKRCKEPMETISDCTKKSKAETNVVSDKIRKWVTSLDLEATEEEKVLICKNLASLEIWMDFQEIKTTARHFFKYHPNCNRKILLLNASQKEYVNVLNKFALDLVENRDTMVAEKHPPFTGQQVYPWALLGREADCHVLLLIEQWCNEKKVDRPVFAKLWFNYFVDFDDVDATFDHESVKDFKDMFIPEEYPCYPTDDEIATFLDFVRIPEQLPLPVQGQIVCPVCSKDLCFDFEASVAILCAGCTSIFTENHQRYFLQQSACFQKNRLAFLSMFKCIASSGCSKPCTISKFTSLGASKMRSLKYCSEQCFEKDEQI